MYVTEHRFSALESSWPHLDSEFYVDGEGARPRTVARKCAPAPANKWHSTPPQGSEYIASSLCDTCFSAHMIGTPSPCFMSAKRSSLGGHGSTGNIPTGDIACSVTTALEEPQYAGLVPSLPTDVHSSSASVSGPWRHPSRSLPPRLTGGSMFLEDEMPQTNPEHFALLKFMGVGSGYAPHPGLVVRHYAAGAAAAAGGAEPVAATATQAQSESQLSPRPEDSGACFLMGSILQQLQRFQGYGNGGGAARAGGPGLLGSSPTSSLGVGGDDDYGGGFDGGDLPFSLSDSVLPDEWTTAREARPIRRRHPCELGYVVAGPVKAAPAVPLLPSALLLDDTDPEPGTPSQNPLSAPLPTALQPPPQPPKPSYSVVLPRSTAGRHCQEPPTQERGPFQAMARGRRTFQDIGTTHAQHASTRSRACQTGYSAAPQSSARAGTDCCAGANAAPVGFPWLMPELDLAALTGFCDSNDRFRAISVVSTASVAAGFSSLLRTFTVHEFALHEIRQRPQSGSGSGLGSGSAHKSKRRNGSPWSRAQCTARRFWRSFLACFIAGAASGAGTTGTSRACV